MNFKILCQNCDVKQYTNSTVSVLCQSRLAEILAGSFPPAIRLSATSNSALFLQ